VQFEANLRNAQSLLDEKDDFPVSFQSAIDNTVADYMPSKRVRI